MKTLIINIYFIKMKKKVFSFIFGISITFSLLAQDLPPNCTPDQYNVQTSLSTALTTITANGMQLNVYPQVANSNFVVSATNALSMSVENNTQVNGFGGFLAIDPNLTTSDFRLEVYTSEHHIWKALSIATVATQTTTANLYDDINAKIKWGLTHYWRWIAVKNGDTIKSCPWYYFTPLFAPPLLNLSPSNLSATYNGSTTSLPAFQVNYNRAVTKYVIELNTASDFTGTPITYDYTGNFAADENPVLNFPTCSLSSGTTYYVRIKAMPDYSKCTYDATPQNAVEELKETLWSWEQTTAIYSNAVSSDYVNNQVFSFTYSAGSITAATDMSNFPTNAVVNTPLSLTATITPSTASYQHIIWHLVDAGTTGATISGDILLQLQPVQQK